MQVDHRKEENRLEIARPVEIVGQEPDDNIQGYMKNLSQGGMRARFDEVPKLGDFVTLELALEDENSPVEKRGEVIWCAPDIYGAGAEVGLKFVEKGYGEAEGESLADASAVKKELLAPGQKVFIDADGTSIPAVVEEVSRIDNGDFQTVRVSLILDDGREAGADDSLEKADEWKPHPFRDVKDWCVKYLGPVAVVLAKILAPVGRLLARGFKKIWTALPKKHRARVETLFGRLDLTNRTRRIGAAAKSLILSAGNLPKSN